MNDRRQLDDTPGFHLVASGPGMQMTTAAVPLKPREQRKELRPESPLGRFCATSMTCFAPSVIWAEVLEEVAASGCACSSRPFWRPRSPSPGPGALSPRRAGTSGWPLRPLLDHQQDHRRPGHNRARQAAGATRPSLHCWRRRAPREPSVSPIMAGFARGLSVRVVEATLAEPSAEGDAVEVDGSQGLRAHQDRVRHNFVERTFARPPGGPSNRPAPRRAQLAGLVWAVLDRAAGPAGVVMTPVAVASSSTGSMRCAARRHSEVPTGGPPNRSQPSDNTDCPGASPAHTGSASRTPPFHVLFTWSPPGGYLAARTSPYGGA